MTLQDDLRALALIDRHHGSLRELSDASLSRLTILVQRQAETPIVVAAVKEEVCPIDPTATFKVQYWLSDIRHPDVQDFLLKSAVTVGQELARQGHTICWGWIPRKGRHLAEFLDRMEAAGAGRWESADAMGLDDLERLEANALGRFYIAKPITDPAFRRFMR